MGFDQPDAAGGGIDFIQHRGRLFAQLLDVGLILLNVLHQRKCLFAEIDSRLQQGCTVDLSWLMSERVSRCNARVSNCMAFVSSFSVRVSDFNRSISA